MPSIANWPDHYAALGLDHWATTEEVKAQFRALRSEYFNTDVTKYRKLQMAYAVLVDWEARRKYDVEYRQRLGLPPPPSPPPTESSTSSPTKPPLSDQSRSLSVSSASSVSPFSSVKAAVSRLDAQTEHGDKRRVQVARLEEEHQREAEEERRREEEEERRREEEEEEEERRRKGKEERRLADPDWALKHFSPVCKPMIGTVPYHSYVPTAVVYEHGGKKTKARRPSYMRGIAKNARP
ncbi:hypothetical protein N0V90_005748 [Kalmusia sp. IMI 367209]|nr:hypothetical protein N0V90_005748 [Kalmusia sp. IMI 367209]